MVQENRRPADGSFPQRTGPERDHHRRPGLLERRVRDGGLRPPRTAEKGPPHLLGYRVHGRVRASRARREVAGDLERLGPDAGEGARPAADGGDPQGGRRPRRVRGGPSPACPPAGRGRDPPHIRRPSEIPPQAPLRERGLGRREDGLRGRRAPDVPERWRCADRRREPGLDRGPQRDGRGNGHVGGTHLERFRGGPTPPARVRRHRGNPPVSGDVMGHDPWADLREQAERIRHSIESSLGVTRPGVLQEAPEDRGLFALAAHGWAAELKASPASIATRAARVPVVPPYRALNADGPYVNFSVEPGAFAEHVLAVARSASDAYGASPPRKERGVVEHTSTNPTGPLNVGRSRNPFVADALVRLMRIAGYPVTSEYLVNDIGRQMVLLYWAVTHLSAGPSNPKEPIEYRYVKLYQKAGAQLEADGALKP